MKAFKVNKRTGEQPYIYGLRLPFFGFFIGIIALSLFSLIGQITFLKLSLSAFAIIAGYLVLLKLSTGSLFGFLTRERFPNSVKNY